MSTDRLTRRRMLALTGGAATVGLAGCTGGGEETDGGENGVVAELDVYVAAYHWGYTAFDENGNEFDVVEVDQNTEVTIHAVNDHAYDAFEELPDPVAAELEEFDALGRLQTKVDEGDLPEPEDATVEDVYGDAHGHGHDDDGHDDDDHHDDDDGHHDDDDDHHDDDDDHHDDDDGHHDDDDDHHDDDDDHDHGDGMLDHGLSIPDAGVVIEVPADAEAPTTDTVVLEEPGEYEAACTVNCGYYHTEQQDVLFEVTDA